MPSRNVVARELADIFRILANADRVRMIEELRRRELDVNTLASRLDLPGPRVSQHLSLLRAHRFVEERREGRHHYYHLTRPEVADWIVDGLEFVETRNGALPKSKINAARRLWTSEPKAAAKT